jgi:hypothetical protein
VFFVRHNDGQVGAFHVDVHTFEVRVRPVLDHAFNKAAALVNKFHVQRGIRIVEPFKHSGFYGKNIDKVVVGMAVMQHSLHFGRVFFLQPFQVLSGILFFEK